MDLKHIVDKGIEIGFTRGRVADPSMIKMEEVFRDSCKSNICGKYDTSWMGPPQIGEIADLKKQVETFPEVIILQSEKEVEDSFDLEAMAEGAVEHNKRLRALVEEIHKELPRDRFLPLGVDCCDYCDRCAYLDDEPCRHPDKAMASVEAYGMDMTTILKNAEMPYYGGGEKVLFTAIVFFK